jgi:probable HAF family extracellular repeat protein
LTGLLCVLAATQSLAGTAYTMTDLGTLGGDNTTGNVINARGQIAGYSDPESGADHIFLYDHTGMHDLGVLEGGTLNFVYAINDNGQVVGTSVQAYRSEHGSLHDLGTLGGSTSHAYAINSSGQVVGVSEPEKGRSIEHAFLYDNTGMHDLGTLGGSDSEAWAINDKGQIIGISVTDNDETHAFLYDNTAMHDLGTLGGHKSKAYSINSSGQVVGVSETEETRYSEHAVLEHAFLYDNTGMHDLGTLGGDYSEAWAINDNGQIVGQSHTVHNENHAFLYDNTGMHDLGPLNGSAYRINSSGQAVGSNKATPTHKEHAFLFDLSGQHDLNCLLVEDPKGWTLTDAVAINDMGWIVAMAEKPKSPRHTFLLKPVKITNIGSLAHNPACETPESSMR